MLNKAAKPKTQSPRIFSALSQVIHISVHMVFALHISESYPTFHSDKLSLFLVTHFCFSVGRLFITCCIRRAVFYSTYPKCPSERTVPACFSSKARTWESAQMTIKRITENLGCLIQSRQNNFKAYKISTISFCCTVGITHYQYGFVVVELSFDIEHQQTWQKRFSVFSFYKRNGAVNSNDRWPPQAGPYTTGHSVNSTGTAEASKSSAHEMLPPHCVGIAKGKQH